MTETSFVALIHKDEGSDYGVTFPDFPGCVTAGETLQDALRMAREALTLHIMGMVEEGEPVPRITADMLGLTALDARDDAVVTVISVPEITSVHSHYITTKAATARLDAAAAKAGMTRDTFMRKAIERRVDEVLGPPVSSAVVEDEHVRA